MPTFRLAKNGDVLISSALDGSKPVSFREPHANSSDTSRALPECNPSRSDLSPVTRFENIVGGKYGFYAKWIGGKIPQAMSLCREKMQLLSEYNRTVSIFSELLTSWIAEIRSQASRTRLHELKEATEQARLQSVAALARLKNHIAEHGCELMGPRSYR